MYPFSGLTHVNEIVLERAAVRGTKVHKVCESLVRDLGDWKIDDEIAGYVDSFKMWLEKKPQILDIEKRFYCQELQITGQVDMILDSPDGHIIFDLKTSAKSSKTWPLQGSAYKYLANISGYNVTAIHFLQLDKMGKPPTLHVYEDRFDLFKKCLDVYKYFYKDVKKSPSSREWGDDDDARIEHKEQQSQRYERAYDYVARIYGK